MSPDPDSWELASAIVSMGNALHLEVVAEGVEHLYQLNRLRELGCGFAQGYYLARPIDGRPDRRAAGVARPRSRAGSGSGRGRGYASRGSDRPADRRSATDGRSEHALPDTRGRSVPDAA